jgi:hypothetical protein
MRTFSEKPPFGEISLDIFFDVCYLRCDPKSKTQHQHLDTTCVSQYNDPAAVTASEED